MTIPPRKNAAMPDTKTPSRRANELTPRTSTRVKQVTVSLATLSEHLGLSTAAISRVLSGAPAARSIPEATQQRIVAAAEQFGYRPNLLARSLRQGRSMTAGVLVPELSEGYITAVLAGVEKVLLPAGYAFLLNSHHHSAEVMHRSQRGMTDRAVDGILAIDTTFPCTAKVPLVTVAGRRNAESGTADEVLHPSSQEPFAGAAHALGRGTHVLLDQARGVEMALDHLLELGHRRIAVIRGQSFSADSAVRWDAVQAAAARRGLRIAEALVAQLEEDLPTHEPGYLAARRLLARGEAFTALLAFNDISAIGAIRALREAGRRVPEDVSVVGFDDIQAAAFQNPALTTVRQPLRRMGEVAAAKLLEAIAAADSSEPSEEIMLEPEFVVRESTAPVGTRPGGAEKLR